MCDAENRYLTYDGMDADPESPMNQLLPAPCMRHATYVVKTIRRNYGVVAVITIRLQIALKAFQQALGYATNACATNIRLGRRVAY